VKSREKSEGSLFELEKSLATASVCNAQQNDDDTYSEGYVQHSVKFCRFGVLAVELNAHELAFSVG
jgi:hypothetical protein